jgi:3-oxoacyl-[acyl-carrier protein] reductase
MIPLKGMSVLITGGGSGIGAGCAKYFAEQGARVTISGRREKALRSVADRIGPACEIAVGDVTKDADRRTMLAAAIEHGGGLDVLINCAGNISRGAFTEVDEQQAQDIFNSNVIGPMVLTSMAVPALEKKRGSVIFIGSVHTRRAFPGRAIYAATKGALQTLTRVLAGELGPKGIRVNCVIPGAVPTEINIRGGVHDEKAAAEFYKAMGSQHPLGRIGTAEEIAESIEYLVTAEWTTGAILDVDGGLGLGVTLA